MSLRFRARLPRWLHALLLTVLLLPALPAGAATLTATVAPNTIIAGDTVQLVLSLTDGAGAQPPDISPLTRDFDIAAQDRRSRPTTINGRRVTVNEWIVTLVPKKSGKLTIPPLQVAGLLSQPLTVTVVPAAADQVQDERPIFVRLDAGDVKPFVQSDVPVTVRVFDRVGMLGGGISPPQSDGAALTPQGEQRQYVRNIGKWRYNVIEQNYLMRPQRSGKVEIKPVTLRARVPGYDGGQMPSEMARMLGRQPGAMPWLNAPMNTRELTLESNPLTIDVRERPADAKGWFLPAKAVSLSSEWSSPPKDAKVGEVLTRTIRLEAQGAGPNQLPPVTLPEVPTVRQYEERSTTDSVSVRGEPGALLTKVVSVVPTRAGPITLPPIEVGWWNTATQTQQTAILPAETFTVAPDPRVAAAEPPPAPAAATPPPGATTTPPPAPVPQSTTLAEAWAFVLKHRAMIGAGAGIVAAAFVVAMIARRLGPLLRRRRTTVRTVPEASRAGDHPRTPEAAEQALALACRRSDAAAAHRAVLAWLRLSARGSGLATPRSVELEEALAHLRTSLYGPAPARFDGAGLMKAFKAEQKLRGTRPKAERGHRLDPLYPSAQ
ncbi:BatD family protein [Xanthobacteraceae bacterium A53D]